MDNLYAWVYNETKEKNCLFDEALCHIGYNKLNEGFWCHRLKELYLWDRFLPGVWEGIYRLNKD